MSHNQSLRILRCAGLAGAVLAFTLARAAQENSLDRKPDWVFGGTLVTDSTPALGTNGLLYVGDHDGKMWAITPDAEVVWQFRTDGEIKSSPALDESGNVYFGSRDRHFYALDQRGRLKWKFATRGWVDSSAAITHLGTIYFGSWDGSFHSLQANNGHANWQFKAGGGIASSPAVARDGTIYFGSHDRKLYALNSDGRKKWEFPTGKEIISSPAIGPQGEVYFTSCDGNFYALNPDGSVRWQLWTGGVTESSPVIDLNGNLCVGVNNKLVCISSAGSKLWEYPTQSKIIATPTITADNSVYFPSYTGELWHIDSSGKLRWLAWITGGLRSSPVITRDGTVIQFASDNPGDKGVKGGPPLATSPWPTFRGNVRHTGVAP